MCLSPPPYAVPCPPGKHCVETLLERTAACGDGCRRRPPPPLAERGPCGSGSFLPAGSQTPLRGPAPPPPLGRRSLRDRVIQPSPPAASDVAARIRAAGAGPPGAHPPRPRLPRGRPPAAATCVVGVRLGRAYSQPCRLQAARFPFLHHFPTLQPTRAAPRAIRCGDEVGSSSSPHFAKTSCTAGTAQFESELDESLCKIWRSTGLAAGLFGRCTILVASLMHNDALSLSDSGALL